MPYWIYPLPHGASVERHVLVLDHLLGRLGVERAKALAAELRIDLRPPSTRR